MEKFVTSLLREKFVLHRPNAPKSKGTKVLSNRICVVLGREGEDKDVFIVRAQNMHICTRVAAKILQVYQNDGPLMKRSAALKWEQIWKELLNPYEETFNTELWAAVYNKGKPLFKTGAVHPFLDLIEYCDANNKDEYEEAIPMAEAIFQKKGDATRIEYDGNVALNVNFTKQEARCGIILRRSDKTTTFSLAVLPKNTHSAIDYAQILSSAAAFLEGVQLAFLIGMNNIKIMYGLIEPRSEEEKKTREATARLGKIGMKLANLETLYHVNYRPERPSFKGLITEAEHLAQKIFTPAGDSDFV